MKKPGWMIGLICCSMLLTSALYAKGDESPCEIPPHGDPNCGSGRFKMVYPDNSGPASYCNNSVGKFCMLRGAGITPTPAWVTCLPSADGAQCTVWPQGDLEFNWAVDNNLVPDMPPNWSGPSQFVKCGVQGSSGLVSVMVTSPDGYSETVFTSVECHLHD